MQSMLSNESIKKNIVTNIVTLYVYLNDIRDDNEAQFGIVEALFI